MPKKSIDRTIQYWLLTDVRTGLPIGPVNWRKALRKWSRERPTREILGDEVQGIGYEVESEWKGLALSKVRDHVPKQGEFNAGARDRVRVNEGWYAIDDAFVYFCGPGNVIAVMAESQQAMRINRIVQWLDQMLPKNGTDPEFRWGYEPVIDTLRRQQLERAHGIKMAHFEGVLGKSNAKNPGLIAAMLGQTVDPGQLDGLKVEIKLTRDQSHGSSADEEQMLDMLAKFLGPIDAETAPGTRGYSKFSVKPQGSSTEIDLIKQRLTRKSRVSLNEGPFQAIFANSAFAALRSSYEADEEAIRVGIESMFDKGTVEKWDAGNQQD